MSTAADDLPAPAETAAPLRPTATRPPWRNPGVAIGAIVLLLLVAMAVFAPFLGTSDPTRIDPTNRNKKPFTTTTVSEPGAPPRSFVHWMGTDSLGRDVYSRTLYGARISLVVGVAVAAVAVAIGLVIGLTAGFFRPLDGVIMRVMDGLMAIPGVLLALALLALWGAGLGTVVLAIAVPEIPRVVRLVRSVVLSVREEPFVEAARGLGTPVPLILWRHILPSTTAPLLVQGTYACASAILLEAILSFLGVGIPTDTPSWGNIMAEGRTLFRVFPHTILFPGLFLALTVLAVNMLGDGLRDTLDPKLARRF